MESNREKATKALLSRFTDYSQPQIIDIMRLLDLAKEVDHLDQLEDDWDEKNIRRNLNLFNCYFSYKDLHATGDMLSVNVEPNTPNTLLLLYLALFQYSISNQVRTMGRNVYDSANIRAKSIIPETLSFKGYVLNLYYCEGDYAKYIDYLFFGLGRRKGKPIRNDVIFFRATRNQISDYFNISKAPEVGSYLDFTNHSGKITVNEEAFIKAETRNTEKGLMIPKSQIWRGKKF